MSVDRLSKNFPLIDLILLIIVVHPRRQELQNRRENDDQIGLGEAFPKYTDLIVFLHSRYALKGDSEAQPFLMILDQLHGDIKGGFRRVLSDFNEAISNLQNLVRLDIEGDPIIDTDLTLSTYRPSDITLRSKLYICSAKMQNLDFRTIYTNVAIRGGENTVTYKEIYNAFESMLEAKQSEMNLQTFGHNMDSIMQTVGNRSASVIQDDLNYLDIENGHNEVLHMQTLEVDNPSGEIYLTNNFTLDELVYYANQAVVSVPMGTRRVKHDPTEKLKLILQDKVRQRNSTLEECRNCGADDHPTSSCKSKLCGYDGCGKRFNDAKDRKRHYDEQHLRIKLSHTNDAKS